MTVAAAATFVVVAGGVAAAFVVVAAAGGAELNPKLANSVDPKPEPEEFVVVATFCATGAGAAAFIVVDGCITAFVVAGEPVVNVVACVG